jgi:DNA polymerase-1
MADLSFDGLKTGIIYGLIRDALSEQELYQAENIVWCFDCGISLRVGIYPDYKISRRAPREASEEEEDARKELRRQIGYLRRGILPQVGFKNILIQQGFEADDLIAAACEVLPVGDDAVIVSTDADLFQLLLEGRVSIWNPAKKVAITENSFHRDYGIDPMMWPKVKAIAGCPTDDVPGVKGVGEKTAIKFLTGELGSGTKAWKAIMEAQKTSRRNLCLTKLPFPGVETIRLRGDSINEGEWQRIMEELGIRTMRVPGVKK